MVITLRVEGVSISAISRIKGIAWNTAARWLEKAAQVCRRFNHRRISGFAAEELQADEIRTFAGNKKTPSQILNGKLKDGKIVYAEIVMEFRPLTAKGSMWLLERRFPLITVAV